jgi:hypothetical protein
MERISAELVTPRVEVPPITQTSEPLPKLVSHRRLTTLKVVLGTDIEGGRGDAVNEPPPLAPAPPAGSGRAS